ncbi:RNA polymerase sigma-70 factor [Mucilaginibacter sp. CAU 1740]|uniref:RNA polymerase sigma-70 factor n=1 Tax=Mucilaginibacter sp. CAU 1740 TaxID=3140365 RepID=UPI00325B9194
MDVRAFESFFHRYHHEVATYALTLVKDSEEGADVVQQAFVKLWQQRQQVDLVKVGRAYLYKTVYHLSLDVIKHRDVRQRYAMAIASTGGEEQGDDIMEERLEKMHVAVQQLPEQCRRVFLLSRVDHKKYREIASELQIAEKTVENHMGNALKILRKILNPKP